ncbi:MAG: hypothetical protein H6719_38130 [Sandaracinaceae bacterium]|nr:hypothetical protein [Sandaracinaceae bacterium]
MQRSLLCCALLAACASPPSTELYAHPWPDERLRGADGRLDLSSFPVGTGTPLRQDSLSSLRDARGFGVASAVLFPFDAALEPTSLPDVEASAATGASVFIVDVDAASEGFGERAPIDVRQLADAGPFGGLRLLVALPYPGRPLRADTLYAAVVTTSVLDDRGAPLPSATLELPTPAHAEAARALEQLGVPADRVAALAVFRTDDPTRGMRAAVEQVLREEAPTIEPPELVEEHDDYCVYRASIDMPVYQGGRPPFESEGGGWVTAPDGSLVLQSRLASRVWITVPRVEAATYPTAVLVRAGAGGDRPLVDRGPRDADGWSPPGTGLARELAEAGYVGLSVDGPLGGVRNLAGWDEQTAMFNVLNPPALRDNVRQSALELVVFAHALDRLAIDASDCAGASSRPALDPSPVLIGHSTGATIAPLAAAVEPRFRALVMSGAGASWIRQIMYKQSPLPLRPFAEALVGYWPHGHLREHDPILSLLQWAGEPADPMVYGGALRDRDVLVFQGVVDTYIPPPISNPLTLGLGLDLAGEPLDEALGPRPAAVDLALGGGVTRALPAGPDARGRVRVVTQHPDDGIEDGHEVLFQQPAARRQLRCFLASLAAGAPSVPRPELDPGCGGR